MLIDSPTTPESGFAPHFTACAGSRGSDPRRLEAAFRLRFDVYCIDCAFLDAADHPDGRERDHYDDEAMHFYAYNLARDLVGYVRLIQGASQAPLPWQLHCRELLPGVVLPDRHGSAEVSRLMVRRDYRRRKGDLIAGVQVAAESSSPADGNERRASSPQIMLSLYRQMYQFSRSAGIRHWYAAMERPLARTLRAMGFTFHRIGAETDYFGPVAPYLADLREIEAELQSHNPRLLAWIQAHSSSAIPHPATDPGH